MGHKKSARRKKQAAPPATSNWGVRNTTILAVSLVVVVLIGVGWWRANHRAPLGVSAAPVDDPTKTRGEDRGKPSRDVRGTSSDYHKLKGKWVRSDGGYLVDIKNVDESGKMDAAYLNPRPIHVARAEASRDGAVTKVFIELRDVNYPGSTYTLTYDPLDDQLTGVYFQAVQQQRFDVTFDRVKE
jgi:hypothetical protein